LVWVFYVSFVLRFTWLPTLEDTLIPFLIGLLEFAMIDLMYPNPLGVWFLLLASIYGIVTATAHVTMRRVRGDPSNEYYFQSVKPSSWRDYLVSGVVVMLLAIMGVVLLFLESNPYLSVAALFLALIALLFQFRQARRYWMHSLVPAKQL
jgi:nicotinamide riboside transporter PnuC